MFLRLAEGEARSAEMGAIRFLSSVKGRVNPFH